MEKKIYIQKEPSQERYTIIAIVLVFFITAVLILIILRSKPDLKSELIIRRIAAKQLSEGLKNPIDQNNLKDQDFAKITDFSILATKEIFVMCHINSRNPWLQQEAMPSSLKYSIYYTDKNNQLSDIRLLAKFTNLKKLDISSIIFPENHIPNTINALASLGIYDINEINISENHIPQYKKILAKLGIYDIQRRYAIDLRPLKKLVHLEELKISGAAVKDINPLEGLNLKHLQLIGVPVSDIKSLKSLSKLQSLEIIHCPNITDKEIEDLQKALPELKIS